MKMRRATHTTLRPEPVEGLSLDRDQRAFAGFRAPDSLDQSARAHGKSVKVRTDSRALCRLSIGPSEVGAVCHRDMWENLAGLEVLDHHLRQVRALRIGEVEKLSGGGRSAGRCTRGSVGYCGAIGRRGVCGQRERDGTENQHHHDAGEPTVSTGCRRRICARPHDPTMAGRSGWRRSPTLN